MKFFAYMYKGNWSYRSEIDTEADNVGDPPVLPPGYVNDGFRGIGHFEE